MADVVDAVAAAAAIVDIAAGVIVIVDVTVTAALVSSTAVIVVDVTTGPATFNIYCKSVKIDFNYPKTAKATTALIEHQMSSTHIATPRFMRATLSANTGVP